MKSSSLDGGNEIAGLDSILLPQHLEDLRKSGINDDQIRRCGFRSSTDAKQIANWLGWGKPASNLGPCLAIPFHDVDGKPLDYVRIKADRPRKQKRKGKKGDKPIKYESPIGVSSRAYFPPLSRSKLVDTSTPIILTEGEKKAAKADQEGFVCIGLVGVYGFQLRRTKDENGQSKGDRELIPDLAAIPWKGRLVYIAYDSDLAEKPEVQWAEWHLAETLQRVGARVLAVRIPPANDGAKQGLDDFLVNAEPEAFRKLIALAKPVEIPYTESRPNDELDNPHRLAIGFCDSLGAPLRYWRGDFLQWDKGAYRKVEDADIRGQLTQWVRRDFMTYNIREIEASRSWGSDDKPQPATRKVSNRLIADVINALKGECLLSSAIDSPSWIDGETGPEPVSLLPMRNGILDIYTKKLLPLSPKLFTLNACPFEYDSNAPPPNQWLQFLQDLWPDDPDSIATLQEWFGYLLTPDTRQQKILFLLGPKRSGKGTICRVLSEMVGRNNFTGPTLSSLATNFGLSSLLGKTVAIVSDARLGNKADASIITERLLSISGEDGMTIDRKYREQITTKLLTRFVIASNELLRLGDASGALVGRLILLRFTNSFYKKEDHGLTDRLLKELPGILNWSLEGWQRLHDRGSFLQPASGDELMEEFEDLASPVGAFVKDRCRVESTAYIEVSELYTAWERWCETHGRKQPGTEQTFGRDLRAVVPSIKTRRPKLNGERWREYVGIRLRTLNDTDDFESGPRGSAGSAVSSIVCEANSNRNYTSISRELSHIQQVATAMSGDADLADPVRQRKLSPLELYRDQRPPH